MYYYIAEPPTNKRNQITLTKLRAKLAPSGVAGEFVYRTPGQQAFQLATKAIASGFNTIIAIGGEKLFNEVSGALYDQQVALGLIPMDESKDFENIIGYDMINDAIEAIRRRKLVLKDVGTINGEHFFLKDANVRSNIVEQLYLHTANFSAQIKTKQLNMVLPANDVPIDIPGVINFIVPKFANSPLWLKNFFSKRVLNIDTQIRSETAVIQAKNECGVFIANTKIATTPFTINILPQSLRLIVRRQD